MTKKNILSSPARPVVLIFREILSGDVKKQLAKSNVTQSGGGARDLRFRNVKLWIPFFARMFTTPTNTAGVYEGLIHWVESDGSEKSSVVSYWRPTKARPNELRIGRIHQIGGWKVDERAFAAAITQGRKWFYGLYLDDRNRLWAKLIKEGNLDLEPKPARDYIAKRIKETKSNQTVYGAIDLSHLHQTLEAHISSEQIQLLERVSSQKKPSAEAIEAVDEVTRGHELEEVIAEWVKRNEDKKPEEVERRVKLLKRCYGLVRSLKKKYEYRCQIEACRFTFKMRNGQYYCEASHIKPLKDRAAGIDVPENILILCPNHHKMLDFGAMLVISPEEVRIEGKTFKIIT